MNNQHIIIYLNNLKAPPVVVGKKKKDQQDEEVRYYYDLGYFNPFDYEKYLNHTWSYEHIMQVMADRMNDNYYHDYIFEMYGEGYIAYYDFLYYEVVYYAYEDGDIGYDEYIHGYWQYKEDEEEYVWRNGLEYWLQLINYNILRNGGQ